MERLDHRTIELLIESVRTRRTEVGRCTMPISRTEAWGAVASMLVALPSSIAFGVVIFTAVSPQLAGGGAVAGIVGAATLGILAPLVSRNGGFITAPCAPAAAVMATFGAHLSTRDGMSAARILALLGLIALTSGILQIVYGTLRLGRLIKYIPYQVVTGYADQTEIDHQAFLSAIKAGTLAIASPVQTLQPRDADPVTVSLTGQRARRPSFRSAIVHAGRSVLDEDERHSLGRIRECGRRVPETHLEQLWTEQGEPQTPK